MYPKSPPDLECVSDLSENYPSPKLGVDVPSESEVEFFPCLTFELGVELES